MTIITDFAGAPKGNRTPVFAVKGRRPGPLDDGRGRNQRWERYGFAERPQQTNVLKEAGLSRRGPPIVTFAGTGKQSR